MNEVEVSKSFGGLMVEAVTCERSRSQLANIRADLAYYVIGKSTRSVSARLRTGFWTSCPVPMLLVHLQVHTNSATVCHLLSLSGIGKYSCLRHGPLTLYLSYD